MVPAQDTSAESGQEVPPFTYPTADPSEGDPLDEAIRELNIHAMATEITVALLLHSAQQTIDRKRINALREVYSTPGAPAQEELRQAVAASLSRITRYLELLETGRQNAK